MKKLNSSLAVIGALLGIGALGYASVKPSATGVIGLLSVLALLCLGWVFYDGFGQWQKMTRKQALFLRLNNILLIASFFFVMVLINLIVRQFYFRTDLSALRRYTLAAQSQTVARGIDREVEISFFGVEGGKEYQRVRELLEMYRYLNRNIVFSMYDLDRVPLKAKELNVADYNSFVLKFDGKITTGKGSDEEAITNLLIRGTRRKVNTIRFLQGHQERSLSETERDGYGKILRQLTDQGYRVIPHDLAASPLKTADTDLLIVAAPRAELSRTDYDKLIAFRDEGGKILVLTDSPPQASPLLNAEGVHLSDFPVYDSQNIAGTDPSSPLVTSYPSSPITRNFGLSTVFPGVYGLYYKSNMMLDYSFEPLVQTSPENWYEKNGNRSRDENEHAHPITIAALITHPDKLMKMVVFADSDFAANSYLSVAGNANLFLNVVNWLCGEGAMVSVAPQKSQFVPMFISDQQARILRVLVPVGIPFCIMIVGTAVWIRRRRL